MSVKIYSDQSRQVDWFLRRKTDAVVTINVTQNNAAYNLSSSTFIAEVFKTGESTPFITLTQGSGITNGGASGVLTLSLTDTQLNIASDQYFWKLRTTAPTDYLWFNGKFIVNEYIWDAGTTSATVNVALTVSNTTIDLDLIAAAVTGGGGGSYTDEEAQDAVGGILQDTETIDLQYDDATPYIRALLKKDFASGLISGGAVTINGGNPARIDISAGTGVIVDFWTTPGSPVFYPVTIPATTNLALTNLATSTLSFIAVDKDGTILQYATEPTNVQRRDIILLAQVGHTNNTTIGAINSYTSAYGSTMEQLRDLISELHLISTGNIITSNGANLKLNKSTGFVFGLGLNYTSNAKNPNRVTTGALSAFTFRYRTQTGAGANTSDIDPTSYDNAGVITAIPGGVNQATNQRIYLFPNNNVVVQYGQTIYTSLSAAISGVQNEVFTKYVNVDQAAILIGILSVTKGATDLSISTNARFLRVSRLGEEIGSSAGISVSTLQNAYNNSTEPEILTDSTRGALTVKRGSAADTDNVIEVKNGADSTTAYIKGDGAMATKDEAYGVSWNGSLEVPTKNAVYDKIETKQDTLVSGTNIKTINSESILGSGNLAITGETEYTRNKISLYLFNSY